MLDVLAHRLLVTPYSREEVAARPKVLADKIPLPASERASDVDRALALDVPDHLRYRVLRRDRDHHVYMVHLQVPFFDLALPLPGQRVEHLTQSAPQLSIDRALRYFGMNTTWYFHSHFVCWELL